MKITQYFTYVSYPQANGQIDVTKRNIFQDLRVHLHKLGKNWVEKIDSALWAYRTTTWTATRETSFILVYGSEAVLPVEIR